MINFSLVTLAGTKFSQEVYEVVLPTANGYIAVFDNHMSLVTLAVPGIITIRLKAGDSDSHMQYFATNGGVIEIENNKVRVLVDEADNETEIDEAEVKKAMEHARSLRADAKDQISIEHAQSLVDRQASRLRVAELRRNRSRRS